MNLNYNLNKIMNSYECADVKIMVEKKVVNQLMVIITTV